MSSWMRIYGILLVSMYFKWKTESLVLSCFKVGSWDHVEPSSISRISHFVLSQCWPNFKSRFLGPSLVNANFHRDISPWNHFIFCGTKNIIFWSQFFLIQNFFGLKIMFTQIFWTKLFFTQSHFCPIIFFSDQTLFGPKMF